MTLIGMLYGIKMSSNVRLNGFNKPLLTFLIIIKLSLGVSSHEPKNFGSDQLPKATSYFKQTFNYRKPQLDSSSSSKISTPKLNLFDEHDHHHHPPTAVSHQFFKIAGTDSWIFNQSPYWSSSNSFSIEPQFQEPSTTPYPPKSKLFTNSKSVKNTNRSHPVHQLPPPSRVSHQNNRDVPTTTIRSTTPHYQKILNNYYDIYLNKGPIKGQRNATETNPKAEKEHQILQLQVANANKKRRLMHKSTGKLLLRKKKRKQSNRAKTNNQEAHNQQTHSSPKISTINKKTQQLAKVSKRKQRKRISSRHNTEIVSRTFIRRPELNDTAKNRTDDISGQFEADDFMEVKPGNTKIGNRKVQINLQSKHNLKKSSLLFKQTFNKRTKNGQIKKISDKENVFSGDDSSKRKTARKHWINTMAQSLLPISHLARGTHSLHRGFVGSNVPQCILENRNFCVLNHDMEYPENFLKSQIQEEKSLLERIWHPQSPILQNLQKRHRIPSRKKKAKHHSGNIHGNVNGIQFAERELQRIRPGKPVENLRKVKLETGTVLERPKSSLEWSGAVLKLPVIDLERTSRELDRTGTGLDRFDAELEHAEVDPEWTRRELEDGIGLCSSRLALARVSRARNEKGFWKVIVNFQNNSKYNQDVYIEECKEIGYSCDNTPRFLRIPIPSIPKNVSQFTCKQKFLSRNLLSWSTDEGFHIDSFSLPVACVCAKNGD